MNAPSRGTHLPAFVRGRFTAWWLAALMLVAAPSSAGPTDYAIDRLHHAIWTQKDGAPSDIWAISQTSDGWMWLGSPDGLYRFDGVAFQRVETLDAGSERSRAVSVLMALESGGLLIGYRHGGVAILQGNKVSNYHEDAGFDDATVLDMSTDADHRVWVATRTGLHRFDGHAWRRLGPAEGLPEGAVLALMTDSDGRIWAATASSTFTMERGATRFVRRPGIVDAVAFQQSPDGRIWYLTQTELRLSPVQPDSRPLRRLAPGTVSQTFLFEHDGSAWSLSDLHAARFAPDLIRDRLTLTSTMSPPLQGESRFATGGSKTVLEDRNGNIWITTLPGELHEFSAAPLQTMNTPQALWLAGEVFASTDGSVWVPSRGSATFHSNGDGLWRLDAGPTAVQSKEIPSATVLTQTRSGDLLVAGDGWLWRRTHLQFEHEVRLPAADPVHTVSSMAEHGANHSLWISVLGMGLFERRGDAWVRNGSIADMPNGETTTLASDGQDTLWTGYADGSVRSVNTDARQQSIQTFASHVGAVRVISAERMVLVAGDRGLAVFREGALSPLIPSVPSSFEGLTGIAQANNGDIWLNGKAGLLRIRAADMREALERPAPAAVRVRVYDANDGYPGNGASKKVFGNTLAQAPDGRLWFSGATRIGWLDPATLREDPDIAPIFLRSVTTAAGRMPVNGPTRLAAGTRDVQIDYTALNYSHPEREQFRYRLTGLDDTWTDAGSRRQAFFTNLSPGRYRFEVQSHNETGDWQSAPTASVEINIPPTFFQSKTFAAFCVAVMALALYGFVQWRVRRATREAEQREHDRMRVRMGERERIAREIHDSLLQNVQAVSLMLGAASSRLKKGQPVAELLDRAASCTAQAVVEARGRVCELRADDDINVDVDVYSELRAIGERLSGEPNAAKFAMTGTLDPMRPEAARELLSIGKEALLNAYRHARAEQVSVRLERLGGDILMQIDDNGIGIGAEVLRRGAAPGHWGLPGLRERARRLNGVLTLSTLESSGTRIELRFEAPSAMPA